MSPIDEERIRTLVHTIKEARSIDIIRSLLPTTEDTIRQELDRKITFLHGGLLVFPEHLVEIQPFLTTLHLTIFRIVPSRIVQQRVAHRYQLDIQIIESVCQRKDGHVGVLELFVLPHSMLDMTDAMRDTERTCEHERHIAFVPNNSRDIQEVLHTFQTAGFECDGGGVHPFEDAQKTILYLSHPIQQSRIELQTYSCDLLTSL